MDLPKEKQGPAVFLSLPQNICKCVWHLVRIDLGWTDGLRVIIDKLDKIYLWWTHYGIYDIQGFLFLQKTVGMNINNFLVQYKFLYQKLHKFGNTLPEEVQAFFFLNVVNVSEEIKKLAKMTCSTLTYTAMKGTLKKVFSDISSIMLIQWSKPPWILSWWWGGF